MPPNEHYHYLSTLLRAYQESVGELRVSKRDLFVSYLQINPALLESMGKGGDAALALKELEGEDFERQAKEVLRRLGG